MYLITNRHLCDKDRYLEVLKEASYNGVDYIILREKDLSDEDLERLYVEIKGVVNKDTKIIINNNMNVYKRVDACGIHLSYDSFISYYDKGVFGGKDDKLIGVSTHNIDEINEVKKRYASYLFLSHIYETKCKENLAPKGMDMLKQANKILEGSSIKLIALGGILPSNSKDTLRYCDDIAVMSTIMSSSNVCETINKYYI